MNITEHFSLEELTVTNSGLDNEPNDYEIANLKVIANGLELIRAAIGKPININSAFRSEAVNKAIGGATNSAHLLGYAADITINGMTNESICDAIYKAGIQFDQMIDENKGLQWVHISFDPKHRMQWLKFVDGQYKTVVPI